MNYSVEDDDGNIIEIPQILRKKIINDYLIKRYYWTLSISLFIIGFLLGVAA